MSIPEEIVSLGKRSATVSTSNQSKSKRNKLSKANKVNPEISVKTPKEVLKESNIDILESNKSPRKRKPGVTTSDFSHSTVSPTKSYRNDPEIAENSNNIKLEKEQQKLDESEQGEKPNVCKRCNKPLKNLIKHL